MPTRRRRRDADQAAEHPLCIAWTSNPGRAQALASVVAGDAFTPYPQPLGSRSTVLRYFASALATSAELLRRRPRVVLAQNPPVIPGLLAWLWVTLRRGVLVLDSHPVAFGAKNNRQGRLLLPVSRWLSRRAAATLVTTNDYVDELAGWGATGLVVHEPPVEAPGAATVPFEHAGERLVLFATLFSEDEPVAEVVEVATSMPAVTFIMTGKRERCPVPLDRLPPNCVLPGFLPLNEFLALMAQADAVLSLTDEATSVARSAYEATYVEVPLVISAVPAMLEAFPWAVPCGPAPADITEAVRAVLKKPPSREKLREARQAQLERWAAQRRGLLSACGLDE